MREKIFIILVLFVAFFGVRTEVSADIIDHSLNYDIESFELSDNNILTITGWGFIHNYDNYGYDQPISSYYGNNITKNLDSSAALHLYFYFKSGDSIVGKNSDGTYAEEVSFINGYDFTYDMCYKDSSNRCLSGANVYKNLKFTISIDLNKYSNAFNSGSNYSLYLFGKLGNVQKEVTVAVAKGVTNKTATEMFEISKLSNKIDVSGNHVIFSGLDFWRLTSNDNNLYYYGERAETSGYFSTYKLYYGDTLCVDGSKPRNGWDCSTNNFGPGDYLSGCGWNFDGKIDSPNGDGAHYTTRKCIQPSSSESGNYKTISARFVNVIGSVKIKFKGSNDHICNTSTGNIDACTGGSVQNSCSKMTVYANVEGQDISAVVNISESSSIISGEEDEDYTNQYNSYFGMDYSKYYIVRGKTFHYALTYKNTASWEILDRSYSGISSESVGDAAIKNKMKDYYTEIGSNFAAKVSIKSNDREKFNTAGYWDCNDVTKNDFANNYNNNNDTFSTTLTCKYVLKYLELDGNGKDTYGEKKSINDTELTLGNNFYIPLDYKNNKFTWEVTGSDLSTVKVRINTNNKTSTDFLIKTSINSDSNKCYVNVVGPNNTPDTSDDPGYYPSIEYKDDKLYVYRSVSVSNPFPDDNIPENWNDANLINRLKNSYQNMTNPDYETVPLNASIVRQIKNLNTVYTEWSDTKTSSSDNSGNNTFVVKTYFEKINGKHCKYGLYDPVCDRKV